MKFNYAAFIENTSEMREWLDSIDRKRVGSEIGNMIMCINDNYMSFTLEGKIGDNFRDAIDCCSNPSLFKAVAAVKKGSDEWQWFTDGKKWVRSDIHDLLSIPEYLKEKGFNVSRTHKAALSELQEYFKMKKQ